jgi:hypothetical protein
VTFHDYATAAVVQKELSAQRVAYPFAAVSLPSGKESPAHVRVDRFHTAPAHYLGRQVPGSGGDGDENAWPPVCIVWKSPPAGNAWGSLGAGVDRGLFWSPKDLGMPTVGPFKAMGSDE